MPEAGSAAGVAIEAGNGLRYHFTGYVHSRLADARRSQSMLLTFLESNWLLVLVMLVSGAMLAWPLIQGRLSPVREVGAMQATQLINRQNALMLDVRETQEYEGGRVPNALHVPLSQLAGRVDELKKFVSRPVIAYCERGVRSRGAAGTLAKLGFSNVYTLRGGLRAWSEAGLPVEKS